MPITINGSGTVTGISAGGLPDDCIVTADIADNNVTTAKIDNISVTEIKIADGAVSRAKRSEDLTLETAKNATGTSVDFTGIPSWVKRVTVMFDGVSTNGSSLGQVQLGAGSVQTSGYVSLRAGITAANAAFGTTASTTGLLFGGAATTSECHGLAVIATLGNNIWTYSATLRNTSTALDFYGGGVTLSGTLDRVRITTVNGTDTFDAGSINIMYE